MGNARARGAYEDRKAAAIAAGRWKREPVGGWLALALLAPASDFWAWLRATQNTRRTRKQRSADYKRRIRRYRREAAQ